MQPAVSPAIRYDHLSVSYGTQPILQDIDLTIEGGSFVVLLGPSGSGKTTLLRTVNRMVEPSEGRVLLGGTDVRERNPVELRREIGYVMQASGLFPHRTVAENITTVPRLNGMSRKDAAQLATTMLSRVGLDSELASRYPAQLSGGQQQRVGVARALAADTRVLLMDEPFAAVDPITRRALQRETLALHQQTKATILFVTHDVDEALALGDRIIVLAQGGRIAQDGTPGELLTAPADPFVADLLGIATGDRSLHVRGDAGSELVVDGSGRPIGILER
ncbi:ABC transporter ATP-binding protein [Microbacterium sp. SSM24]|uniref:ABC transporter ATP-binding protein n=1 Tax=Microbacterium sp. SSM24 TaxID=2991714 RepID=UPI002227250F|nr:ABC transporter ATP-binding protein [Microbacterium sp. SSM24]MCW3492665.1 ABC transporter ATP-binding protein [Microbacterium sp. SSM24]